MTTTEIDRAPEPEEIEPARFARPGPPRPEVQLAREDDPPPDVPRDQWDRPLIVARDGSDVTAYIRASKYGGLIKNRKTITLWDERNIVWGMSRGHHLVVKGQAVREQTGKENIAALQDIAERAKLLAGADAGAMTGTGLHKLSERRDAGEDLSYLDPMSMACLDAYHALISPFEILASETFVVCDDLGGAGTFDRAIRLRFPIVWPDGIVWPAGMIVIIDVKTGKISSAGYWGPDFTAQQLIYATGEPYRPGVTILDDPKVRSAGNIVRVTDQPGVNGRITWDEIGVPGGPSQRWALICHVPAQHPDRAQWERVDLDVAREDAAAAQLAWQRSRVSRAARFLALPAAALVPPDGITLGMTPAGTDDGIRDTADSADTADVDTGMSTDDIEAAKAATAAANREQTTATLLTRIRRADSTDKIDQLYDSWGTSAAWTDELTDACQAAYDRLTPPEEVAECDGCNYDRHLCPLCGVNVAHGVGACAACSLRVELEEAPDLTTLEALWLAHGPAGDGLWADEHSDAAQTSYDRLSPGITGPPDEPADELPDLVNEPVNRLLSTIVPPDDPARYPLTITEAGQPDVTLHCHECLLPVDHPQSDDPAAWCDCIPGPGEDCFDAAVCCKNRAHDPADCPNKWGPAPPVDRSAEVFQGPDDDPAGPPAGTCAEHGPHPDTILCQGCIDASRHVTAIAQQGAAEESYEHSPGPAGSPEAPEQPDPHDEPTGTGPYALLVTLIVEATDETTLITLYEAHKPVDDGGDGLWDDDCTDRAQAVYDRLERERDLSHGPVPDGEATS